MKLLGVKLRRVLARRLSFLAKLYVWIKFKFISFKSHPPIIILTPGKVGSSSVYYTLKEKLPNHIFHIHYISEYGILESKDYCLATDRKSIPLHLIISNQLRKKLLKYDGEVFVISIVREPISREVSNFFQNSEILRNTIENQSMKLDIDKTLDLLPEYINKDACLFHENWFEKELLDPFGIDVFSKNFEEEKQFEVFENEKYNLLVMKTETMSTIFPKAIKYFLNTDRIKELKNYNDGEYKHYSKEYKLVKNQFKIGADKLEKILNSKFVNHFYFNEKSSIRKRWEE